MTSDVPEYSVEGLIGLAVIHSDDSTAIIYCEDAGYEVVYERLIKKISPELGRFVVACTGGKTVTQKLAKRKDEIVLPCAFLIDKDFDDLLGYFEKRRDLGITYLRRYSLENYLVQPVAFTELTLEELARTQSKLSRRVVESRISDCNEFLGALAYRLLEVSRYFVVCQKYRLGVQTCKTPGDEIFPDSEDEFPLPDGWFANFQQSIVDKVSIESDWMLVDGWIENELRNAFETSCLPWGQLPNEAHIVGKHQLFGLLTYLDARFGTEFRCMSHRELYLRLLNHMNFDELLYLKDDINGALARFVKVDLNSPA